jgi:Ni/Fe-hydrogenase 1 B-type cytochrome subunit
MIAGDRGEKHRVHAGFSKLFAWIVPLLGVDLMIRQIHYVPMWGFIIFAMINIYLVVYHDYIERRGVSSSMIGGWKFLEKENLD